MKAGLMLAVAGLLAPGLGAHVAARPRERAGAEYRITHTYENSGTSSGSSKGHSTVIERVIDVSEAGVELEYDLPNPTPQSRIRDWQFPVRVFKPASGPMRVLNRSELESRIETWLEKAGLERSSCGSWYFTWNAFRVECNPDSVLKILEGRDLRIAELRDGALYEVPEALGPGTLSKEKADRAGTTFVVTMEVDPDAVRRTRAEADVVSGEIMRTPVTLETALRERAKEAISGTIFVNFEVDLAGRVHRRTKVTKLEIREVDGETDSRTSTEIVERRPMTDDAYPVDGS